jgi:hypothetical protein
MKKTAIVLLTGMILASLVAITPSGHVAARPMAETIGPKVEVYYFHYSRRCAACRNVENESKRIVETLYADLVEKGEVVFASINLEEQENHALAERCGATGQSLLVISGEERIDITSQGFMHARNSERYEQEIKKVIDPLLGR